MSEILIAFFVGAFWWLAPRIFGKDGESLPTPAGPGRFFMVLGIVTFAAGLGFAFATVVEWIWNLEPRPVMTNNELAELIRAQGRKLDALEGKVDGLAGTCDWNELDTPAEP